MAAAVAAAVAVAVAVAAVVVVIMVAPIVLVVKGSSSTTEAATTVMRQELPAAATPTYRCRLFVLYRFAVVPTSCHHPVMLSWTEKPCLHSPHGLAAWEVAYLPSGVPWRCHPGRRCVCARTSGWTATRCAWICGAPPSVPAAMAISPCLPPS